MYIYIYYNAISLYIYIYIHIYIYRERERCVSLEASAPMAAAASPRTHLRAAALSLRETGGAPRNPAPRSHFSVRIVKPSGCHCTDAFGGKKYRGVPTPLRSTSPFSESSRCPGQRLLRYSALTTNHPRAARACSRGACGQARLCPPRQPPPCTKRKTGRLAAFGARPSSSHTSTFSPSSSSRSSSTPTRSPGRRPWSRRKKK